MGEKNEPNPLAVIAAMLEGDRALPLEAAALVIGEKPGTFRQLASRPGFPKASQMETARCVYVGIDAPC